MGISLPKAMLVALFAETFLFGVYTVLVAVTLTIFLRRRASLSVHKTLVFVTIAMYLLSTAHVVLLLMQEIEALISDVQNGEAVSEETAFANQHNWASIIQPFCEMMNIILADGVLIWRVWVVWGRTHWVAFFPICTLTGTAVLGLLFAHSFQTNLANQSIFQGPVAKFAPPAAAFTLITNVMCTSLIAGRIWFLQRRIEGYMQRQATSYRRVILVVLESGFLYSAAWVAILVTFATDTFGVYVIFNMIDQLTGIVPTVIVLLAYLNLMVGSEVQERYSTTTTTSVQFRRRDATLRAPAGVVPAGDAVTLKRERVRQPSMGGGVEDDGDTYQLKFRGDETDGIGYLEGNLGEQRVPNKGTVLV